MNKRKTFLFTMIVLTLLFNANSENQVSKDTILYYNGNVITMTDDDSGIPIIAQAVLIQNGKIIEVGTSKELRKLTDKKTQKINLRGKTLLPGFIDGHSHILSYAQSLSIAQLNYTQSFDDIILTMKDFQKTRI